MESRLCDKEGEIPRRSGSVGTRGGQPPWVTRRSKKHGLADRQSKPGGVREPLQRGVKQLLGPSNGTTIASGLGGG